MFTYYLYRSSESRSLVYNYASSSVRPISINRFRKLIPTEPSGILLQPSIRQVYHTFAIFTDNMGYFAFLFVFFHFVPATLADAYLLSKGKKAQ